MGTRFKPLADLCGRPLTEWVISALRSWPRVGRIALVAGPEVLKRLGSLADVTAPDQGSAPANLLRAIELLEGADRILLSGCDSPFLRPWMLDGFAAACPEEADIACSWVPARVFEARFPGSPYLRLPFRDGPMVFGSVHLVRAGVFRTNQALFERAFDARKRPLRMLRLIGVGAILRYATRTLCRHHVERRVGELLGCRVVGLVRDDPELAFDVDKPEHLETARTLANRYAPEA